MDGSFHSALKHLVVNDAARLSGHGFAERRGAGVAGRVRTRRTVRAVGMGGVSAVAVGALAVGSSQLFDGGEFMPGSSATPSVDAVASSPFQCGFIFPSESRSVEGLAIEDTGWLTAAEVMALMDRRLNTNTDSAGNPVESPHVQVTTHVDSTQPLPTFTLVDPHGAAAVGGALVTDDPTLHPPDNFGVMQDPSGAVAGQATSGMTFVAVSQATVVGTITDAWVPHDAPPVTWTNTSRPEALTLINPEGAFSACPSATLDEEFDIYAVAGRMTMDPNRVMTGPFYVWSEIPKP